MKLFKRVLRKYGGSPYAIIPPEKGKDKNTFKSPYHTYGERPFEYPQRYTNRAFLSSVILRGKISQVYDSKISSINTEYIKILNRTPEF